ncbi:mucin TcMUCI [Trypanosoma cruzi cruzi]|nr:mucin TcMUCI [Trypanosoma cruzi cruzi]
MMMTSRVLCALLVLALCCCPSVWATEVSLKLPLLPRRPRRRPQQNTPIRQRPPQQRHQLRQPPLQHRHQALRLQRPPTVSTTRAPSSIREIDGSLSSSAWVCAPLVLAASALAYTTVG